MQKQVVVPLALLFLPSATTVIFLLQFSVIFLLQFSSSLLQGGLVLSSPQPAWVHFCLTHQRLFARLWLAGMGCSLLNAALTTWYFARREKSTATGFTGIGIMTPLFAAVVISLPLSVAANWAGNHTSWFTPPTLSHGRDIISVIENHLLPKVLLMVSAGVVMVLLGSATLLIFLCALRCLNELWGRREHLAPPHVLAVFRAEDSDLA